MVLFCIHLRLKEIQHVNLNYQHTANLNYIIFLKQMCQPTKAFQKSIGNGKNNQRSCQLPYNYLDATSIFSFCHIIVRINSKFALHFSNTYKYQ